MSNILELTTAIHSRSLTLFVGSGFSKYLTDNSAPSWNELIIKAIRKIDRNDIILKQLFNTKEGENEIGLPKFDLTICAQIIESEYKRRGRNFKEQIAEIISESINKTTINQEILDLLRNFFEEYRFINIITTNYDTLFSDYILSGKSKVIVDGSYAPLSNIGTNIYHIHGCITNPDSIVITLSDYYYFQNNNNYFSRKFYTLLQESNVAILGYSLGDFNLNTILNEVKVTRKQSFHKTKIFFLDRKRVTNIMKNFYLDTYGITVIDKITIDEFFYKIIDNYDIASDILDQVQKLHEVILRKEVFEDRFLKMG